MTLHRSAFILAGALLLSIGRVVTALAVGSGSRGLSLAAETTLCQEQTAPVSGGTYIVQNNEFDSGASECATTDGSAPASSPASAPTPVSTGASPGSTTSHAGTCSAAYSVVSSWPGNSLARGPLTWCPMEA
jgi:hypothetical protein